MSALHTILVPVDGSQASAQAVDFALTLAASRNATLTLVHSVDLTGAIGRCSTPYGVTDVAPILEGLEAESAEILRSVASRARDAGVATTALELTGTPVRTIVELLRRAPVDAIVMGTHGRRGVGRFFLGSTAEGVLRQANVPVFVVSRSAGPSGPCSRILVAVDESAAADAALAFALQFARESGASVVLAHVLDDGRSRDAGLALLDRSAERAKAAGVVATTSILDGPAVERLVALARSCKADLIAVGTHGRGGIERALLGSVAEGVIRSASVPVVAVRHLAPAGASDSTPATRRQAVAS